MKSKKISIVGVGKLGLCLALNLERCGYEIIGIDAEPEYIEKLKTKNFNSNEPFVENYLKNSKNIHFTTNIEECLHTEVIFVVVKTPSDKDWKFDHTQIENVVEKLISFGKQDTRKDLVINCTTFPGYCKDLQERLKEYNYYVTYNPEFIAQGTIIKDQVNCDNVLIGEADEYAGDIVTQIYKDMVESKPIFNRMSPTEAELTKLSVNCFLTTKISFANMIGDMALRLNCDPNIVLSAIATDSRIGNKYLKYGFGFGGPCFPRDNRALAKCAEELSIDALISKATDKMNELHLRYQIEDFINKNTQDKPVEFEYVTYKKESTLLEESQQLKFAIRLKELGYKIIIKDQRQEVREQLKNFL